MRSVYSPSILVREVLPMILLPTLFVLFRADRPLFSVADGVNALRTHTGCDERLLHRICASVAGREVVLNRAALIAVPFDREFDVGMLDQELAISPHRLLLVWPNVVLIEIEEDVLDVLLE